MEIKIIKPDPTEVEELERDYSSPNSVDGDNDGEINQIAARQVLEIDRDNTDYDDEIDILVRWAKANGAEDYQDIKWAIRDLRMRLGTPTFGDHIKHISRYAYLDLEEKRIKSEKDQYK